MRYLLIYRIIAPIILVVFTITSCNYFVLPEPSEIRVPIGKGDIRFIFLDENYQPTTNDIGRMAMYVENNDLTRDVLVLSEIPNDNIDNDVVVRVINKENDSIVSFFYYSGQNFPHKIAMTMDGETAVGIFSSYNSVTETYSVEFSNEEDEAEIYNDLILNKNVFSLHEYSNELTDSQNVRLRNIITTLALWNSLAIQIDDDFDIGTRGLFKISFKSLIVGVLVAVAVVAVAVVVVLAAPASIAVVGATLVVSLTTTPQVIAATVAVAAAAAAALVEIFMPDDFGEEHKTPDSKDDRRPMVDVTLNNEAVKNSENLYYLRHGESLTFDIKIKDRGNQQLEGIIDLDKLIIMFDPTRKEFFTEKTLYNARYFNVSKGNFNGDNVQITIARNDEDGFFAEGIVQFVIQFKTNVIINGKGASVNFWNNSGTDEIERGNMFILNFKAKDPMVEIRFNGNEIINNTITEYRPHYGESFTFDIKITDYGVLGYGNIINSENLVYLFDPHNGEKITNMNAVNAVFFEKVDISDDIDNIVQITITRNNDKGIHEDGRIQFVIQFQTDVIINNTGAGITFWHESGEKKQRDIFVLNFTARVPL